MTPSTDSFVRRANPSLRSLARFEHCSVLTRSTPYAIRVHAFPYGSQEKFHGSERVNNSGVGNRPPGFRPPTMVSWCTAACRPQPRASRQSGRTGSHKITGCFREHPNRSVAIAAHTVSHTSRAAVYIHTELSTGTHRLHFKENDE